MYVYFEGSVRGGGQQNYLKFKGGTGKNCFFSEWGPFKIFRICFPY